MNVGGLRRRAAVSKTGPAKTSRSYTEETLGRSSRRKTAEKLKDEVAQPSTAGEVEECCGMRE